MAWVAREKNRGSVSQGGRGSAASTVDFRPTDEQMPSCDAHMMNVLDHQSISFSLASLNNITFSKVDSEHLHHHYILFQTSNSSASDHLSGQEQQRRHQTTSHL